MIINAIKKLFAGTVYIQLREEQIRIYHIELNLVYEQRPFIAIDRSNPKDEAVYAVGDGAYNLRYDKRFDVSNPFSHPRLLICNFIKAEKILQHGIRELHKSALFAPSPIAIVHPMEKLEGGVTDIECRVYRELALGAGARKVHLHVGDALPVTHFNLDQVRDPSGRSNSDATTDNM